MKKYIILTLLMLFFPLLDQTAYGVDSQFIEQKYLPKFEEIEQNAVTELNHLIDEAYIEYQVKKEKGEITLPILFAYLEKGKKLEKDVENEFQSLLSQMKKEIKENGLSEDLTYPFEKQYVKSKRKNKLQILKNVTIEGNTINFEREL